MPAQPSIQRILHEIPSVSFSKTPHNKELKPSRGNLDSNGRITVATGLIQSFAVLNQRNKGLGFLLAGTLACARPLGIRSHSKGGELLRCLRPVQWLPACLRLAET